MVGEVKQNMLIRFLIHFLFVQHEHKTIDLFDGEDAIFNVFNKKPINNAKNIQKMQEVMSYLNNDFSQY